MAIEIRPCETPEEMVQAVTPVFHYFGWVFPAQWDPKLGIHVT